MQPTNEPLYLEKSKNGEHWFLMNQLFEVLSAEVAASLGISAKVEAARELFERETAVYKPLKAYIDTKEVDASDTKRDKSYRRFDLGVQSAELSDDESVFRSAQRVRFILDQVDKNLTKLPLGEETAAIFDMVDKLEKNFSEDVETIGQTANLAALKADNEAFQEIYKRRTMDMQARAESGSLDEIRPRVDEAMRYVICLLNALYFYYLDIAPDAEKLAEVKGVISQFNGCVLQYRKTQDRNARRHRDARHGDSRHGNARYGESRRPRRRANHPDRARWRRDGTAAARRGQRWGRVAGATMATGRRRWSDIHIVLFFS